MVNGMSIINPMSLYHEKQCNYFLHIRNNNAIDTFTPTYCMYVNIKWLIEYLKKQHILAISKY